MVANISQYVKNGDDFRFSDKNLHTYTCSIVELDRLNTVINHLKLKLNPKTELWELSTFFCHHRISLDKII